ncbi:DEAD/DEAH box helicase [Catellatospora sichuanensis]|uniref:DEAD/DEAH box helicase n=1 Tax=Catellatospora sichuanensis TaxID=1969805 RepID=UPI001183280E|nr:helicase-related protein [Catellatospora sichuanensis]
MDDLRYEPPHLAYGWLGALKPATCLVVGNVPDDDRDVISAAAAETRSVETSPFVSMLHRGTYAFAHGGIWHVLIAGSGRQPRGTDSARRKHTEDSHLVAAYLLHEQLWGEAGPFAGRARFKPLDMVRARGASHVGRVKRVTAVGDGYRYHVDVQGEIKTYSEQALHLEVGDPRDPEFWLSQDPVGAADLSLTLTWTKLSHPLTDTLYSFASSKTVFRSYQFKPVLKILTGSSGRILIADEVGLGKTIEAGLIWSELEQRAALERVLVVAPAVLTLKWKSEMERRFDRRLDLLRPSHLADLAQRLEDGDPAQIHGVISLESLRAAGGVLENLTKVSPRFDLVIVDEAHYLRNRTSRSHQLGQLLADWSDYLVFLSATPLNLGNDDLFNLLNLLDERSFNDKEVFTGQLEPNEVLNDVARSLMDVGRTAPRKLLARLDDLNGMEFGPTVTDRPDYGLLRRIFDVDRPLDHDELARARRLLADLNVLGGVLTRTRKADLHEAKAIREPRAIDVTWTEAEQAYYDAVYSWYMDKALDLGTPPGFAMQMPLRQAASCIPASQQLLRERSPELFLREADLDEVDLDDSGAPLDLSGLEGRPPLTRRLAVDTKYDRLLQELLRIRDSGMRQVMIFSFFRRTLAYLARRLREHFDVRVMDGSVNMDDRQQIMRDFRNGDFEILLLSEVGAEGLDFEFCNVLVNYDLPWNPMRVEQRIGRLDRFGQQHEKIFIYNMRVPGTIETDIFQRLYDRIDLFQSSIGELEPILRNELSDITKRLLDPTLSDTERHQETERIAIGLKQRSHDIEQLRASQAQLAGIDNMLIDGFTDAGPSHGRFIGATEIERMLDSMFSRLGGRRRKPDKHGIFHIIGSDLLADRLRRSAIPEGGSRLTLTKLAARLQDQAPLECTLRPDTASRYDVELLSSRHPLVKLALEDLTGDPLDLKRFGTVSVPGLPAGRHYLVTVDLAETTGLRPMLELWATAVDLTTLEEDHEVGTTLLTALAEGTLTDGLPATPAGVQRAWQAAQRCAFLRQQAVEQTRGQENTALVDGRIRAGESSLDLQIRKTALLLLRATVEKQADSIIRLHDGRLRNLQTQRQGIKGKLLGRKELSISLTPVAVVLTGPAQ